MEADRQRTWRPLLFRVGTTADPSGSDSLSEDKFYRTSTAALTFVLLAVLLTWLSSSKQARHSHQAKATIATQTELTDVENIPSIDTLSLERKHHDELATSPSPLSSFFHRILGPCLWSPARSTLAASTSPNSSRMWMVLKSPDTERNWLEKMIVALSKVKRMPDGGIDTSSYLAAMSHIPEVYDVLLSLQVVTSFMRRDLLGHVATVRAASPQVPGGRGRTLQGIVRYALDTHDHKELARKTTSMVGGVLWLNRATTFIAAFIRGLADGLPSREAAAAAYDNTLRMYHSAVTAAFVSRAMSLCPDREKIIERLNLPSEEVGKQQLDAFLGLMEPLVEEIRGFLDAMGANFPDRIG